MKIFISDNISNGANLEFNFGPIVSELSQISSIPKRKALASAIPSISTKKTSHSKRENNPGQKVSQISVNANIVPKVEKVGKLFPKLKVGMHRIFTKKGNAVKVKKKRRLRVKISAVEVLSSSLKRCRSLEPRKLPQPSSLFYVPSKLRLRPKKQNILEGRFL